MKNILPTNDRAGYFKKKITHIGKCNCGCKQIRIFYEDGSSCDEQTEEFRKGLKSAIANYLTNRKMPIVKTELSFDISGEIFFTSDQNKIPII